MTLRALTGPMFYPTIPIPCDNALSFVSRALDAAGEKLALFVRMPKAGTLAKVGFTLGTVTTGQPLRVSFQDPDPTTGHPDGVADQYRVVTVANTDDNLWKLSGILGSDGTDTGTKRTVTKGEPLFVVFEFDSAVGNLNLQTVSVTSRQRFIQTAYLDEFLTGAWAKTAARAPVLYLEYDDGTTEVIPGAYPVTSMTTGIFMTEASNPDEVGIRFTVPFRCNVAGVWAYVAVSAGETFEVRLYDSTLEQIATSGTIDTDTTIADGVNQVGQWQFTAECTLEPNAVYYATVRSHSVSTNVTLRQLDVNAASILDAWDGGQACHKAHRQNDTGAFTLTPTSRPMIGLRISGLEDGMGNTPAPGTFSGSGPELR